MVATSHALVETLMDKQKIPVPSVAVTKAGAIVFSTGFGYADPQHHTKVTHRLVEALRYHRAGCPRSSRWTLRSRLASARTPSRPRAGTPDGLALRRRVLGGRPRARPPPGSVLGRPASCHLGHFPMAGHGQMDYQEAADGQRRLGRERE
jgi:hypothetical protein